MKKIIIGSIVAAVIYFVFQAIMWVGGVHRNFYTYTAKQDTIMHLLSGTLMQDGMYMMPMADPNSADFKNKQQDLEKKMPGNPWAMVFYHPKMMDMTSAYMLLGFLYTLIASLVVTIVVYLGNFHGFGGRFFAAWLIAVFALFMGVLGNMNWWSFPWSFVQPQVFDLLIGWGIASLWIALFVKRKPAKA
jgi:hypothetical protein